MSNDFTAFENQFESVFHDWHIVRKIGQGSYGDVFEIQKESGGYVDSAAIKHVSFPKDQYDLQAICSEIGTSEEAVVRDYIYQSVEEFRGEYEIMRGLRGQTHIVSSEDFQVVEKKDMPGYDIFIRMELLKPVSDLAGSGYFDRNEIIRMGIDICSALELLEKKQIVHRDIKPENIFINDNGDYKLGDFGSARTVSGMRAIVTAKGTPAYMSPEVFQMKEVGPYTDLYSLGLVMYRLANENRSPFIDGLASTTMKRDEAASRRMMGEKLPDPKNADPALAKVILKACAFNPADRYQNGAEMRRDLERLLNMDGSTDEKPRRKITRTVATAAQAVKVTPTDPAKVAREAMRKMGDEGTRITKLTPEEQEAIARQQRLKEEEERRRAEQERIEEEIQRKAKRKKTIITAGCIAAAAAVIAVGVLLIRNATEKKNQYAEALKTAETAPLEDALSAMEPFEDGYNNGEAGEKKKDIQTRIEARDTARQKAEEDLANAQTPEDYDAAIDTYKSIKTQYPEKEQEQIEGIIVDAQIKRNQAKAEALVSEAEDADNIDAAVEKLNEAVEIYQNQDNTAKEEEITKDIAFLEAVKLMEAGKYDEAIPQFNDLAENGYADASIMAQQASLRKDYIAALKLLEEDQLYDEAAQAFDQLGEFDFGDYPKASDKATEAWDREYYRLATEELEKDKPDYIKASKYLGEIKEYNKDVAKEQKANVDQIIYNEKDYSAGVEKMTEAAAAYKDDKRIDQQSRLDEAKAGYDAAKAIFDGLCENGSDYISYTDGGKASELSRICGQWSKYLEGQTRYAELNYETATDQFKGLLDDGITFEAEEDGSLLDWYLKANHAYQTKRAEEALTGETKDYETARTAYSRLLWNDPDKINGFTRIQNLQKLDQAMSLLDQAAAMINEKYNAALFRFNLAIEVITELDGKVENASEKLKEAVSIKRNAIYESAKEQMSQGEVNTAMNRMNSLGEDLSDLSGAEDFKQACQNEIDYREALAIMNDPDKWNQRGEVELAAGIFNNLKTLHEDGTANYQKCMDRIVFLRGIEDQNREDFYNAYVEFSKLAERDSESANLAAENYNKYTYNQAVSDMLNGHYSEAYTAFESLIDYTGDYGNSQDLAKSCRFEEYCVNSASGRPVYYVLKNVYRYIYENVQDLTNRNYQAQQIINSSELTGANIAIGFSQVPCFNMAELTNQQRVKILYDVLLDRGNTMAGDQYAMENGIYQDAEICVAYLDVGMSINKVLDVIVHLPEFDALCKKDNLPVGEIPLTETRDLYYGATAFAMHCFRTAAGRDGTAEELNQVTDEYLNQGISMESKLMGFTQYFGGYSNEDYVNNVYLLMCNRIPSEGERTSRTNELNSGLDRNALAESVVQSVECADFLNRFRQPERWGELGGRIIAAAPEEYPADPGAEYWTAIGELNEYLSQNNTDITFLGNITKRFRTVGLYEYSDALALLSDILYSMEKGNYSLADAEYQMLSRREGFDVWLNSEVPPLARMSSISDLANYIQGRRNEAIQDYGEAARCYYQCAAFYDSTARYISLTGVEPTHVDSLAVENGVYQLVGGTAVLVGPAAEDIETLAVKDTIDANYTTYPVTEIADRAFAGQTSLREVNIGSQVAVIGREAFKNCERLENVTGGNGVIEIRDEAFRNCSTLTEIVLETNIESIGDQAFHGCSMLKKVQIKGKKLKNIGSKAFSGCKELTEFTGGMSVETIGESAFERCSQLEEFAIPSRAVSIGKEAFANCKTLRSVIFAGASVEKIGKEAFAGINSKAVFYYPAEAKEYEILIAKAGAPEKSTYKSHKIFGLNMSAARFDARFMKLVEEARTWTKKDAPQTLEEFPITPNIYSKVYSKINFDSVTLTKGEKNVWSHSFDGFVTESDPEKTWANYYYNQDNALQEAKMKKADAGQYTFALPEGMKIGDVKKLSWFARWTLPSLNDWKEVLEITCAVRKGKFTQDLVAGLKIYNDEYSISWYYGLTDENEYNPKALSIEIYSILENTRIWRLEYNTENGKLTRIY